ncbi:PTS sugar transporter subunit IIA [Streptococcus sp.]|uniref:BglG family transcription antiterminator n=1 Tax=Streptococcus sp. TaxID=1306 RepID=UPI001CAFAAE4|nr:PTS sugar transporter subunit IIA [Streptococcus sp.]MBF1721530.1 PTS sugar transporter subunit IIA [Streptococcus sp.]
MVSQPTYSLVDMRLELDISMQTLQKSIQQLNDVLAPNIQIISKDDQLLLEVYDYTELEKILSGSLKKESDFNSSSKRIAYLLKRLIESTSPLLIDDLAEEVGVSRSTLNKDLKQVKSLAEKYFITISGKPNRGLEILGSELNLRLLYIHQVAPYFEGNTLTEETSYFLETLVQDYKIPKETQDLLRKTISIIVERIHSSRMLDCPIPYYRNDLTSTLMAEQLIYHIEMTYKISLSQFEIDFLCFPFNVRFIDTLSKPSYHSDQLTQVFHQIVQKVKEKMLVHFDEAELFEEIKPHLGSLINRLIFHVQANDIFHGEVQNQYPFAFEMAKIAGEELTSIFGSELEKSEIGYLALYFEMILRKQNSAVKGSRKQIAVVCTTGRGTATMIIQQLRRVLGNDVDITQYSEEDFNVDLNQDYFAIFTTVPLKYKDSKSPVIQVNHLFDDQWLQEEWQRANAFHQKNLETVSLRFLRLSPQKTYQQYLLNMVAELEKLQMIDEGFRNRIIDREKKQSTIFGGGIAFPHTINQGYAKTILMFGKLEEPYQKGDEWIEFIFLVAIPSEIERKMESELLELYDDIFRIAGEPSLKEALRAVETETEFLSFSKSKGVF